MPRRLSFREREQFLRHFAPRANPMVMSSFDVQSTTGATVRFYAIALPFTSNQMKEWLDSANFFRVRHSIDKAIKVARFIGCDVVALGQYTSIVTRNATTLKLPHIGLTTGNSYTIALALEAIERAASERGIDPAEATLAVVGASGNIGQTCAEILAPRYRTDHPAGQQQTLCGPPPRQPSGAPATSTSGSRPGCAACGGCRARGGECPHAVSHRGGVCRPRDHLRPFGAGGRSCRTSSRSGQTSRS